MNFVVPWPCLWELCLGIFKTNTTDLHLDCQYRNLIVSLRQLWKIPTNWQHFVGMVKIQFCSSLSTLSIVRIICFIPQLACNSPYATAVIKWPTNIKVSRENKKSPRRLQVKNWLWAVTCGTENSNFCAFPIYLKWLLMVIWER